MLQDPKVQREVPKVQELLDLTASMAYEFYTNPSENGSFPSDLGDLTSGFGELLRDPSIHSGQAGNDKNARLANPAVVAAVDVVNWICANQSDEGFKKSASDIQPDFQPIAELWQRNYKSWFCADEKREKWDIRKDAQPLKDKGLDKIVQAVVGKQIFENRSNEPEIVVPEWLETIGPEPKCKINHEKLKAAKRKLSKPEYYEIGQGEIAQLLQVAPTRAVRAIIYNLSPACQYHTDLDRVLTQVQETLWQIYKKN